MKTFFAFIDDAGAYRQFRNPRFAARNPYFIKACVLFSAERWKSLAGYQRQLLKKYTGQSLCEIKWNHLWKLRLRDVKKQSISYDTSEKFLKLVSFDAAHKYADELMQILPELAAKVVCTVTPNCVFTDPISEKNIERMHLQDLMQRIEMEVACQDPANGLALLFCDQMSGEEGEVDLKEKYHELYCSGDFISPYDHIMDSVSFLSSHQSCGIQLADFVAGAFNGFLRGYDISEKIFSLRIYAHLRRRVYGQELGYGIVDVPKRPDCRRHLEEKFNTNFARYSIAAADDIPF